MKFVLYFLCKRVVSSCACKCNDPRATWTINQRKVGDHYGKEAKEGSKAKEGGAKAKEEGDPTQEALNFSIRIKAVQVKKLGRFLILVLNHKCALRRLLT